MNYLLSLTIVALAGLLLKLWRLAPWQVIHTWPWLQVAPTKAERDPWALWRWLSRWPWWSNPGWWGQKLSVRGLESRLKRAGLPLSVREFYGLKQWLWTTGSLGLLLWLWFGTLSLKAFALILLVWGLCLTLPDLIVLARTAQQQRQITAEVPNFLDLLTLTLQGGSNLEQALQATCQNFGGALSLVVGVKLKELAWGRSLEDLFTELKTEIEDEDFRHFLGSLLRAKTLGVSLSETLAIQTELLRTRRRQRAEELSRTAAVKISVPLVLFIFPALLIIYIGPGVLQLMART